ncbi:MAG: NUDIX domain-containing protein, partial [Holophaga sp.]|nr:NUDIX domain-containing protein [Holophaga sp.]
MTARPTKAASNPPEPETYVVAVDVAVLTLVEDQLHTLLIRRNEAPFKGQWMLPGGVVQGRESLLQAAERVLREKAGLTGVYLEQLFTFSEPKRDPRDRAISVAHLALVNRERFDDLKPHLSETAVSRITVPWEGEIGGPVQALSDQGEDLPLAFDQAEML